MSNFSQRPPPFGVLSYVNPQQNAGYPPPPGPWGTGEPPQQQWQQQTTYTHLPSQFGNFPLDFSSRQRNDNVSANDMRFKDQQLYNRDYQGLTTNPALKAQQNNRVQHVGGINPGGVQQQSSPQPLLAPSSPYYQYSISQDNGYSNWASRQSTYPSTFPQQYNTNIPQVTYENQNQQYTPYVDTSQNSNVYIKGLPPEMTDIRLHEICSSFGNVMSSKCVINNATNICKGFGFALYSDATRALAAIEGLNKLHYQASLARSTRPFCFYKPGSDQSDQMNSRHPSQFTFDTPQSANQSSEASTNVYLCNLPLNLNETALQRLFSGFNVVSVRVLKNSSGFSRGVGFVRFGNHSQAQSAIDAFNGRPIPPYLGYDNIPCGMPSAPLCLRFAREKPQY